MATCSVSRKHSDQTLSSASVTQDIVPVDASYEVKELYVPENKLQLAKTDAESLLTLEINKVFVFSCLIPKVERQLLSRSRYSQNTCTVTECILIYFFHLFLREITASVFFWSLTRDKSWILVISQKISGIMLLSLSQEIKFTATSSHGSLSPHPWTKPCLTCLVWAVASRRITYLLFYLTYTNHFILKCNDLEIWRK